MTASSTGVTARFDFTSITEGWDTKADRPQRQAASLRYGLLCDLTEGGTCIEVACGTGFGLRTLHRECQCAVGGDMMEANLREAQRRVAGLRLVRHDAEEMPFRDGCADAVACLEALYYFRSPACFMTEASRVLRPGGRVLVTVPNPCRPGFHPSPGSISYLGSTELYELMLGAGFEPLIFGAFRWDQAGATGRLVELARRTVVRLGLVPDNVRGRSMLKRFVIRDMRPVADMEGCRNEDVPLVEVDPVRSEASPFIVLYAVGRRRG